MRYSRRYLIALSVVAVALSGCSSLLGSSASGPTTTVKYTPTKLGPPKKSVILPPDITFPKAPTTTVLTPAKLVVQVSSFDFGSRSTEHFLDLHNAGDLPLSWTSTSSASYVTVSPTSGSIAATSSATVTVTVNRLAHFGPFTATITIKSAAGNVPVQVTGT